MRYHHCVSALLLAVAAIFLSTSPVSAIVIRHDKNESLYLGHAQQSQFDAVAKVTVEISSGTTTTFSATLVHSTSMLTAAHVLDDFAASDVDQMTIEWNTADGATITRDASDWFYYGQSDTDENGWDGMHTNGYDLGVIRFDQPVTQITPASLYTTEDGSELNRTATLVGYGRTGTGETGAQPYAEGVEPSKLAADNAIDLFGGSAPYSTDSSDIMFVDFDNPDDSEGNTLGSSESLSLEGLNALGDSGGGVFIEVDGEFKLAGVISFNRASEFMANPTEYDGIGGIIRVSQHEQWLAANVPEPGTLALLSLGSLMFMRRRRHRITETTSA